MIVTHGGAGPIGPRPARGRDEFTAAPMRRGHRDAALASGSSSRSGAQRIFGCTAPSRMSLRLRDGRVQAVEDGTETGFAAA
ncbi:hypothetical protein GS486_04185 [Rhodococcus hoagii]|nr:hypothetical protein [Prescottella equi]